MHQGGVQRLGPERNARHPVRDHVDPQDHRGGQRQGHAQQRRDEDDEHLRQPARQSVPEERADVGVDAPTLPDRDQERLEVVVDQHQVGGLSGHLGAAAAHRHPDVGAPEGRCVVDAVAGHRDDVPVRLPGVDDVDLLLRPGAGVDVDRLDPSCMLTAGDGVTVGDLSPLAQDADGGPHRAGRPGVVAGDHDDPHARAAALLHHGTGIGVRWVHHADQSYPGPVLGDGQDPVALRCQRVRLEPSGLDIRTGRKQVQHRLRSALQHLEASPVPVPVDRPHGTVRLVERDALDAGPSTGQQLGGQALLGRGHEQGDVEGIPHGTPGVARRAPPAWRRCTARRRAAAASRRPRPPRTRRPRRRRRDRRPETVQEPSGVHSRRATSTPRVSVPVLSDANTVTEPSVSTAGRDRTTAERLAIRWAPRARATVTTAGRDSGMAATPRLTARIDASTYDAPRRTLSTMTTTHSTAVTTTSWRDRMDSLRCSGVGRGPPRPRAPRHVPGHCRGPSVRRSPSRVRGSPRCRPAPRLHVAVDRHRLAGHRRLVDLERRGVHQPQVGGHHVTRLETDEVAGHDVRRRHLHHDAVPTHVRAGRRRAGSARRRRVGHVPPGRPRSPCSGRRQPR